MQIKQSLWLTKCDGFVNREVSLEEKKYMEDVDMDYPPSSPPYEELKFIEDPFVSNDYSDHDFSDDLVNALGSVDTQSYKPEPEAEYQPVPEPKPEQEPELEQLEAEPEPEPEQESEPELIVDTNVASSLSNQREWSWEEKKYMKDRITNEVDMQEVVNCLERTQEDVENQYMSTVFSIPLDDPPPSFAVDSIFYNNHGNMSNNYNEYSNYGYCSNFNYTSIYSNDGSNNYCSRYNDITSNCSGDYTNNFYNNNNYNISNSAIINCSNYYNCYNNISNTRSYGNDYRNNNDNYYSSNNSNFSNTSNYGNDYIINNDNYYSSNNGNFSNSSNYGNDYSSNNDNYYSINNGNFSNNNGNFSSNNGNFSNTSNYGNDYSSNNDNYYSSNNGNFSNTSNYGNDYSSNNYYNSSSSNDNNVARPLKRRAYTKKTETEKKISEGHKWTILDHWLFLIEKECYCYERRNDWKSISRIVFNGRMTTSQITSHAQKFHKHQEAMMNSKGIKSRLSILDEYEIGVTGFLDLYKKGLIPDCVLTILMTKRPEIYAVVAHRISH